MQKILLFFFIISQVDSHAFNKIDSKLPLVYGLTASFDNVYYQRAANSPFKEQNIHVLLKTIRETAIVRNRLEKYQQQDSIKYLDNKPAHRQKIFRQRKKSSLRPLKNPELMQQLIKENKVFKEDLIKSLNNDFNKAILNYRMLPRKHMPLLIGAFHNFKVEILKYYDSIIPLQSLFEPHNVIGENEDYLSLYHKELCKEAHGHAFARYETFLKSLPNLIAAADKGLKEKNDARKEIKEKRKQEKREARARAIELEKKIEEARKAAELVVPEKEQNSNVFTSFTNFIWGNQNPSPVTKHPNDLTVVLTKEQSTLPHQRNITLISRNKSQF